MLHTHLLPIIGPVHYVKCIKCTRVGVHVDACDLDAVLLDQLVESNVEVVVEVLGFWHLVDYAEEPRFVDNLRVLVQALHVILLQHDRLSDRRLTVQFAPALVDEVGTDECNRSLRGAANHTAEVVFLRKDPAEFLPRCFWLSTLNVLALVCNHEEVSDAFMVKTTFYQVDSLMLSQLHRYVL